MNEEITAPRVRLIGADGKQVGIVTLRQALEMAEEEGMDLVEVAPQSNPPVCKILDYGKYRYQQSKKEKESRKRQHIIEVKKLRFSSNIDDHDFKVKLKAAREFLLEGNRVKATLMLHGRQMTRQDKAEEILQRMAIELADIARVESGPKLEGNTFSMVLARKK